MTTKTPRFRVGRKPKPRGRVERYQEIWIVRAWRVDDYEYVDQNEAGCKSASSPQDYTGFAIQTDRKGAARVFALARKVSK